MLASPFIPGYDLTEIIHEGIHTVIYRGLSLHNQQRVILKILKAGDPSVEEIARLLHEYKTIAHLDLPGVVKVLKKETYKNRLAIVFEDFGGQSLKQLLNTTKLDLVTSLNIAVKLAQTLADLHSHHIIHKDVKPGNIIINPTTGIVKLTDFSIASQLDSEIPRAMNTNQLEGTLAYMSPEQTGRMNRAIDYRTDFYSLGVTLYEMIVGELPFKSNDPLELVYCHIAKLPPAIEQLNPQIPSAIAAIVMKLMAKNAEDRYQSALGLKADLEFTAAHLYRIEVIPNFIPGECDRAPNLLIPQKLYGREEEVLKILAAFNHITGEAKEDEDQLKIQNSKFTVAMMLVSGYSGIGKSSLVNEVQKPIVRQRGYFISGKFDQFKRNIPYDAIIQAFKSLIKFLLAEDTVSLQSWREKLQSALGDNGQVIADLIPEVELIIGKQLPVQQLGLTEAQNRFHLVFQKFIHVFTQKEHPLVIFLDDLQWADIASLKLIQFLITDPASQYLLLIGAYRDNEVNPYHPLMQTVDEIQKTGVRISQIAVKPLSLACVNQLLCDTFTCKETSQIQELASLLFNKTAGNPFFLTQILKTLEQERLLVFHLSQKQWQWSIERIQTVGITDLGVVELIARNVSQLPQVTQDMLTYAACIGTRFKLDVLAIVTQKSINEVAENLWIALQQGFILPLNKDYKVALLFEDNDLQQFGCDESRLEYCFLHDRVQQAAYSLIPDRQKQITHRKIGQLLLSKIPKEQLQENIFDIVNQLNVGITTFSDEVEQYELAQLNLIAGRKAKTSAAYEPALKYLRTAMELLTVDSWQIHPDLTLDLYKERSEVEFIVGDFEKAQSLIYKALEQTEASIPKSDLYNILVFQYTLQSKYDAALEAAKEGLDLLGVILPEDNLAAVVSDEMAEVKKNLDNQEIASIINKPCILLEEKKVAIKLLMAVEAATIIKSNIDLFVIICLKSVNLSLRYGNIPESVKAYSTYGMILGSFFKDYSLGYEFGIHALELAAKFNDRSQICKASFTLGSFIHCWSRHIKGASNINQKGYEAGLESGELLFGGYNLFSKVCNLFFQGLDLKSLLEEISICLHLTKQIKNTFATEVVLAIKLAILDLFNDELEQKYILISDNEFLEQCEQNQNLFAIGVYSICQAQTCYLTNSFEDALNYVNLSKKSLLSMTGFTIYSEYYFYFSLILASFFSTVENGEKIQFLEQLQKNQQQMKIWADNCPENFLHKYLLVEAEIARMTGKDLEAMDLYDRAIESAREQDFIQNEALALELTAKFWLIRGKQEIGKLYMTKAYQAYIKWGATAKVKQLEAQYSYLSIKTPKIISKENTITTTSSKINASLTFDILTVVKASQALSGEIVLERLLKKLMHLVRENAGAQKVVFAIEKDNKLLVEGYLSEDGEAMVCQSQSINSLTLLPKTLITYVQRTHEPLVLDNASHNQQFNSDPYIITHQPKSILVLPIFYQSNIVGILYLENNLTKGAFTHDRVEVLQILAAQAAISLENANFYNTLETRVAQRTQELQNTLEELQRTQLQMIQNEKMSSLGQLVAGIAHEINNPINFIYGNLTHISNYTQSLLTLVDIYLENPSISLSAILEKAEEIDLEYIRADLPKLLNSLQTGASRIRDIVQSLRNFSRLDEAAIKAVDVHQGIDNTLMILSSKLEGIKVIKEYANLPLVNCYAAELNQVFMHLLTNAVDAIEESSVLDRNLLRNEKGEIRIRTELRQHNQVAISIKDNGIGMTAQVQNKMCDPFFTTKPVGKGNGLGLSISYQIVVEKHGGRLICHSVPGESTEFTLLLPCR